MNVRANVAATILGCRRAGLPSPAETIFRIDERVGMFHPPRAIYRRSGWQDAALHVRHGCLTPHEMAEVTR